MEEFIPHGFCLHWDHSILWTLVSADILIALSYFSIPFAIWYLARKRPDLADKLLFNLFAIFIISCGITHIFDIVTIWYPNYWLNAISKSITALFSVITAIGIWFFMPKFLKAPSTAQLQKAQDSLVKVNENLEARVIERTKELEAVNRSLQESLDSANKLRAEKDLSDDASKAKSSFVANMSHEIRTPMNAVLGMLQLVQRTDLSPSQQDYISKAQSAAKVMLQLLNDILDFSKIDAGKLTLDPHPFELEGLLSDIAIIVGGNLDNKDIEVLFDIDSELPSILVGDSLRLQQILINLIGNGIKFTEKGNVTISNQKRLP